jgi:hypothetical protein
LAELIEQSARRVDTNQQLSGFAPDALQFEIVHLSDRGKLLCEWLLGLDSNQQPSG